MRLSTPSLVATLSPTNCIITLYQCCAACSVPLLHFLLVDSSNQASSLSHFARPSHKSLLGLPILLHIINVTEIDGLLDMIALGNIIEFAVALDYRTHEHIEVQDGEYLEREAAMTHYRTLITWFSNRYGVIIAGSWVNPSYLFKRQLISFGASLGDTTSRHPGLISFPHLISLSISLHNSSTTLVRHFALSGRLRFDLRKRISWTARKTLISMPPRYTLLMRHPATSSFPTILQRRGAPWCRHHHHHLGVRF